MGRTVITEAENSDEISAKNRVSNKLLESKISVKSMKIQKHNQTSLSDNTLLEERFSQRTQSMRTPINNSNKRAINV